MNPPYIPATALGGDIITGWSGEIEINLGTKREPRWVAAPVLRGDVSKYMTAKRLDPRRPDVAHRIADVLRAKGHEVGHLLPVALGGRVTDATVESPCPKHPGPGPRCRDCADHGPVCPYSGDPCDPRQWPCCQGTHTLRRTIPAADVSALLLAASVAGVESEAGVVRGVLGEWTNDHGYWVRVLRIGRDVGIGGVTVNDTGWCVPTSRIDPRQCDYGPETGPEGRAAADAALLRLGYAYLDPAAPFGVVVPAFDLENER